MICSAYCLTKLPVFANRSITLRKLTLQDVNLLDEMGDILNNFFPLCDFCLTIDSNCL